MRAWPLLVSAVALLLGGACSLGADESTGTGRDPDGRVLTGTVLDLRDGVMDRSRQLVVIGETPWGAIHACPPGDVAIAIYPNGASATSASREDPTSLVAEHLAGFGLDADTLQWRLKIVPPELAGASVVVAATWLEREPEPVAAWFTIAGAAISGYRGCTSWFAAESG